MSSIKISNTKPARALVLKYLESTIASMGRLMVELRCERSLVQLALFNWCTLRKEVGSMTS